MGVQHSTGCLHGMGVGDGQHTRCVALHDVGYLPARHGRVRARRHGMGVASASVPEAQLIATVARRAERHLGAFNPQQLADTAWACSLASREAPDVGPGSEIDARGKQNKSYTGAGQHCVGVCDGRPVGCAAVRGVGKGDTAGQAFYIDRSPLQQGF